MSNAGGSPGPMRLLLVGWKGRARQGRRIATRRAPPRQTNDTRGAQCPECWPGLRRRTPETCGAPEPKGNHPRPRTGHLTPAASFAPAPEARSHREPTHQPREVCGLTFCLARPRPQQGTEPHLQNPPVLPPLNNQPKGLAGVCSATKQHGVRQAPRDEFKGNSQALTQEGSTDPSDNRRLCPRVPPRHRTTPGPLE